MYLLNMHLPRYPLAVWLLAFFMAAFTCRLTAQSPSPAGWPVKWTAGGKDYQGQLTFNNADKTLTLTTADGKKASPGPVLQIFPKNSVAVKPTVQELPDLTVAVLSYQERLSGRLQSLFKQPGQLQWQWPQAGGQSAAWNPAVASAWLFHPDVTVLAVGPFKGLAQPGSGGAVDALKSPVLINSRPMPWQPGTSRLWQLAFYEPESAAGSTLLQAGFRAEGVSGFQEFLKLDYNPEKTHWQLAARPDMPFENTPLARKPGWHFLSLLVEKDRSRVCIDDSVLAETRSSLLPELPIIEFQLQPEPGQVRSIASFGFYAFQSVPPVVQRPLNQDLVQIDGGHELMGENRIQQTDLSAVRAYLPRQAPATGRWANGPVALVTFRSLSGRLWNLTDENEYLSRMGLLQPPQKLCDRVEGAIEALSPSILTLALSQGGSLQIPLNEIQSIGLAGFAGIQVLESRPHHLGDEIDLKVIPPEPEGNKLAVAFESDEANSTKSTQLAVDVLQVLGANIAPFIDSIARGELVTEVWLNDKNLGTLNSRVQDRNEIPKRVFFEVGSGVIRTGPNRLEFRQKGQKNDPNYLDDLSILGVRLYHRSAKP